MTDNQKELVNKMIQIVEDIIKENDKDQFDANKQGTVNKTLAKNIISELEKVINDEN